MTDTFEKTSEVVFLWHLKKIVRAVFSRHALPKTKIGLPNLDTYQFFYCERLIQSKRHLKRSLCIEFNENCLSHFLLREPLPKPKNGLTNLNFHKFFCNKYYIYIQKYS